MAQQALSGPGRRRRPDHLGIGPSHPVVIERMYGLEYTRPAAHTREYVEVLRRAFAASATSGEPGAEFVAYEGEFFDVNAMLVVPGADAPVPILVAALAPLMLRLAESWPTAPSPIGRTSAPQPAWCCASPPPRRGRASGAGSWPGRRSRRVRSRRRPRAPSTCSAPTRRSRPISGSSGAVATPRPPTSPSSAPRPTCRLFAAPPTPARPTVRGADGPRRRPRQPARRTIQLLASVAGGR